VTEKTEDLYKQYGTKTGPEVLGCNESPAARVGRVQWMKQAMGTSNKTNPTHAPMSMSSRACLPGCPNKHEDPGTF